MKEMFSFSKSFYLLLHQKEKKTKNKKTKNDSHNLMLA